MPNRLQVADERQQSFLPEERYTPVLMDIPMLAVAGVTLEPGAGLVGNIRRIGLLNPITVVTIGRTGTGATMSYQLIAGRRRLAAMRQIRGDQGIIPANVYPVGTPLSLVHAMSISENVQRRPNPLTDLRAIEELIRGGADEEQIARTLHLPIATIRSRLRLAALIPALREALESDQIAPSVAERAARLNTQQQESLIAQANGGRITADNVAALFRVQAQEQMEAMPDEVFNAGMEALATTEEPAVTGIPESLQSVTPGWPGVLQCLVLAGQMMPVPTNADQESAAGWLTDLFDLVNSIIREGTP